MTEPDPLRRFERDALVAAAALTLGCLAVTGGRLDVAGGVAGGACLMALSYRAIKGGVDALLGTISGPPVNVAATHPEAPAGASSETSEVDDPQVIPAEPPLRGDGANSPALSAGRRVFAAVKFFTRYALLAVGAYVMLTRFRLHPVGLVLGATTPFVAAVMQVARIARTHWAPGKHPF